jgi:hypothetical protein
MIKFALFDMGNVKIKTSIEGEYRFYAEQGDRSTVPFISSCMDKGV